MNLTSEAKQKPLHVKESSNPVLAYPFEMVKPSRIQGRYKSKGTNVDLNK